MRPVVVSQLILGIFGLVFLAHGIYLFKNRADFLQRAVEVPGKVIENRAFEIDSTPAHRRPVTFHPVFEFLTLDGLPITAISEDGKAPATYAVGDRVSVVYDRSHPQTAFIKTRLQLWLAPAMNVAAGLLFLTIVGGLSFVKSSSRDASIP